MDGYDRADGSAYRLISRDDPADDHRVA